jgi:hypothetical protein
LLKPTPSPSTANATPAMINDTILPFSFPAVHAKKITAAFDGGRLTSNGGVMLLAMAERPLFPEVHIARPTPATKGEASLRGHLQGDSGKEQTGSQSYIPPDAKDDKALAMAVDLLRGTKVNPAFPPSVKNAQFRTERFPSMAMKAPMSAWPPDRTVASSRAYLRRAHARADLA